MTTLAQRIVEADHRGDLDLAIRLAFQQRAGRSLLAQRRDLPGRDHPPHVCAVT